MSQCAACISYKDHISILEKEIQRLLKEPERIEADYYRLRIENPELKALITGLQQRLKEEKK